MEKTAVLLKDLLVRSVDENQASGILLSGGLDSSVLAALSPKMNAISVSLESYGEDIGFAQKVTKYLKMEHFHRTVKVDEAIAAIPEVIRILKSFDPALPNDIVVYFGLKKVKESDIAKIMFGDGSDELFAGYSFMQDIKDLSGYTKRISQKMIFSSNEMGLFFKIEISQPFIAREIIDFSLRINTDLKIREHNGVIVGEWILRKAFEEILPQEIIWQSKRPLEIGSGMTELRKIISDRVSDEEFKEHSYPVKFYNKEHLYYYKVYREVIGEIPKPKIGEKTCPGCGAGMSQEAFHCKICGWVGEII